MSKPSVNFLIAVFFLLFFSNQFYSQNKTLSNRQQNVSGFILGNFGEKDYKIISSNSSFIEIEFYPQYSPPEKIKYNNSTFIRLSFDNAAGNGLDKSGKPDIMFRVFPVIFPSVEGNTVTVIDYDMNEVTGIDLAPVQTIEFRDPERRDFENIEYKYIKDNSTYLHNKFLPDKMASVEEVGPMRDILIGSLVIYPYRYNPAAKKLLQYTRIRVRVNFGKSPVMINRVRSREEINLLKDIAVNSDVAQNWMNPKFILEVKDKAPINSLMSTGDWYKIEIKDNGTGSSDGIYKMSKSFLENAGINLANVDPRTIKMYGNGGDILPENLEDPRTEDLSEIAIYIDGQEDGHFDQQDYILFYGKSINNWKPDTGPGGFKHYVNYYSSSNYYWIRLNTSGLGRRMAVEQSLNVQNPIVPSSFSEKLFYEPERNNLILEGNLWLSERISSGQSFTWNNTLTGIENNSDIIYKIKAACHVYSASFNYMLVKEDFSTVSPVILQMTYSTGGYGNWIGIGEKTFTVNQSQKTNGEQSRVTAEYLCSNPTAEGYLDWMEIHYKRRFSSVTGDFLHFYAPDDYGVIEYNLSPFSNNQVRVFEVTQHKNVVMVQPIPSGTNGIKFQRSQNLIVNEYFAVGQNGYKTPSSVSQRVPNQNLHGAFLSGADYIIITHKDFNQQANLLKGKREAPGAGNPNYLKTLVFDVDQVYNEFSCGVLDATAIRDFIKYCYENWQKKPSYVCLFGDGSIDYRSILVPNGCKIPPYEYTDPYINETNGYTTDDYFVDVVPDEYNRPDIPIGRIPANTNEDASAYLDKINCYEDPSLNGNWKNKIVYVADDGTTTAGQESAIHTIQSEQLSEEHTPASFEKFKLYLVAYPTVITSQGRRKPDVNRDIIKYWNEGIIAANYTGHGSPDVWAHEYVFEKNVTVSQLNNVCKYPFLTVASCDFSKFDNPFNVSGGELLVVASRKGAIGSLGAARPTDAGSNSILNNAFWGALYTFRDTLLLQNRFGKAIFQAKNATGYGLNSKKYILLADPTIRTQVPRYISKIDSMEGLHSDTMSALSKIIVHGSVLRPDLSLWSDYNGRIDTKIFDVIRVINMTDEWGTLFVFKLPGGLIYSGGATVKNGKWRIEFIVPKDISYKNEHGKFLSYFYNSQADGSGLDTNFIVGGINPYAEADTIGPQIKLFLNTRNFKSSDVVNSDFKLLADLYDESGINTTGTIGHKIEAVLDDNNNNKYDLTNFYNSDTTYKSGSLSYDFYDVPEGKHKLRLRAWDTYNNSSEAEIEFSVSDYTTLRVTNVFNYPNPFAEKTSFTFQHNYPGAIKVSIKIYTVSGRLIKEIDKPDVTDKFVVIDWAGIDQDGDKLANGVYLYKLSVTADDGKFQTALGKLAVLK